MVATDRVRGDRLCALSETPSLPQCTLIPMEVIIAFSSLESKDSTPSIVCALKKGANHGYGALVSNLGRNNRLRRLGCRRDDHCGLALALAAHGTTCRHSR